MTRCHVHHSLIKNRHLRARLSLNAHHFGNRSAKRTACPTYLHTTINIGDASAENNPYIVAIKLINKPARGRLSLKLHQAVASVRAVECSSWTEKIGRALQFICIISCPSRDRFDSIYLFPCADNASRSSVVGNSE